jgi:hypothetical protein
MLRAKRYYKDDTDAFIKRFVWTPDGKLDSFRILSDELGKLRGDCDDFAVTALYEVEGKSLWRFWWSLITLRAVLWYVKGEGFASHMVLYHKHLGWIDNQYPEWGDKKHTLRFPTLFPWVALKMLLGKIKK